MKHRLEKLHRIMEQNALDAVAIIPGANMRYLTGAVHNVMERPFILIIPQQGQPAVIIPVLEAELFASKGFDAKLIQWQDKDGYDDAFKTAIKETHLDGKRIGVEGQLMRYFESLALQKHAPAAQVIDAHKIIGNMRLNKDQAEIDALRKAIKISEAALQKTLDQVKVGMSERQIANILVGQMNALGGEGLSFDPIVAASDNSARPHAKVREDYAVKSGDPLLFDYGTTYGGYNADITRTVFVGQPSDHFRAIYEAVQKANKVGKATSKVGVTAHEVDDTTLQSLKDSGFESLIVHKTGHGLGLDVHEEPYIMQGNHQPLEAGMVFTVEPGLYESGAIGVRIEDNVVMTAEGCESLSTFPRDLMVVGD
jgi:Xaa-Pro dipeptidase